MADGWTSLWTSTIGSTPAAPCKDYGFGPGLVMGYFDGSTVTAFWNYAQHFAMNDNAFDTTFGPSTPGALNLISGQTHGAFPADLSTPFGADTVAGSVVGDPQPALDDCSSRDSITMSGKNIGDLLNARAITWGWFQGGRRRRGAPPAIPGATASRRVITSPIMNRSSTTRRR